MFSRRIVLFFFIILLIGGLLFWGLPEGPWREGDPSETKIGAKAQQNKLGIELEKEHPYGKPIPEKTRLWWENDPDFQSLCLRHQATVRRGAFQTTLPDPLPGEEHNVQLAASIIAGKVVNPGEVFSTNGAIGPRTTERNFQKGPAYYGSQVIQTVGGGICKIASTLYNVAILADLEIVERWPHSMLVPYVPPGQDATIAAYKDFRFRNNTGFPLVIWAESKDQTLYIAFYGKERPPKVIWQHEILGRWDYQTIYRKNDQLKPGEERVIIPGAEGMRVRSWLTIEAPTGEKTIKKRGVDYYYPLAQVVERNPGKRAKKLGTIDRH